MSVRPAPPRVGGGAPASSVSLVDDVARRTPARARISPWPRRRDVAQLALVDHEMIPVVDDVDRWVTEVADTGARLVRTNALFPAAAAVFEGAGFDTASELVLLRLELTGPPPATRLGDTAARRRPTPTRRMRRADLEEVSAVDQMSFPDSWANDERSLEEIRRATPHHRSRVVVGPDSRIDAFAISGRAATAGYLQRLAVRPAARRGGLARSLVDDALGWMRRRGCASVLVNTAVGNEAALALYRTFGFRPVDTNLRIMERAVPR
jgi:ribosomal protein S18 acetylase RimI-like enzyme